MRICAVIPAAGKGTRLGLETPKILLPVDGDKLVWTLLRQILTPYVDCIHVVVSPAAHDLFCQVLEKDKDQDQIAVSTSIQAETRGMGDAIFGASKYWSSYDSVLIAWGDQVNLSSATIAEVATSCGRPEQIILPLTRMPAPYVQYDFDEKTLVRVRQSREGDKTDAEGHSDVGLFALSAKGLDEHWQAYLESSPQGTVTGEINFLPFLPFLSKDRGWKVDVVDVADSAEARGVNTLEDLEFARARRRSSHQADSST